MNSVQKVIFHIWSFLCTFKSLPEEYNVILDGLLNQLTLTGPDVLTNEVIYDKLKSLVGKIKNKGDE